MSEWPAADQFAVPTGAVCTCVILFAGSEGRTPFAGVPGCCGAYFEAHFACNCLA